MPCSACALSSKRGCALPAPYSRSALRQDRAARAARAANPEAQPPMLGFVPPDAPILAPERAMHVWDGRRFIPWNKWLATVPIEREDRPQGHAA
jgi:hypothetical protein